MPIECSTSTSFSFFGPSTDLYTFEFLGITPLGSGNFRWCYEVSVELNNITGRGLSHFILEFCPTITAANVSNVQESVNGGAFAPVDFEFGNIKIIPPNASPSIYGLKFNDLGLGDGETAVYCFDLNVNVLPQAGDISIKVGGGAPVIGETVLTQTDAICTPGCEAGRGIIIK